MKTEKNDPTKSRIELTNKVYWIGSDQSNLYSIYNCLLAILHITYTFIFTFLYIIYLIFIKLSKNLYLFMKNNLDRDLVFSKQFSKGISN